jgi:hypothetical protein
MSEAAGAVSIFGLIIHGTEPAMLELNPDTVGSLIDKAQIFHSKEGAVIPGDNTDSSGNLAADMLTDHQGDNTFREFKTAVDDLEPDQQVSLVALMWVGRGDFEPEEWDAALAQAQEQWTPHTAEYLLSTPLLADYLKEGLSLLGYPTDQ